MSIFDAQMFQLITIKRVNSKIYYVIRNLSSQNHTTQLMSTQGVSAHKFTPSYLQNLPLPLQMARTPHLFLPNSTHVLHTLSGMDRTHTSLRTSVTDYPLAQMNAQTIWDACMFRHFLSRSSTEVADNT